MTKTLRLDIWSDIACPWCYIGKRRFEAALAEFPHRESVQVVWRSFQLDPNAPRELPPGSGHAQRLADKYGVGLREAQQMIQRVSDAGAEAGIDFQFDKLIGVNTFDAHRLLHQARARGVQYALKDRLLRAYFTEGRSLSNHDELVRLGAEAGLDVEETTRVLASDAYAADVRQDVAEAQSLGIRGVPFFVLGRRFGISGAQPAALFLQALEQAWAEPGLLEVAPAGAAEADVCGPDGCEVPAAADRTERAR